MFALVPTCRDIPDQRNRSLMKRALLLSTLLIATIAAFVAVKRWAIVPFGFHSYLSSDGETDAEMIRRYWPHRLIQPEWMGPGDRGFALWHVAEAGARVSVVVVLWSMVGLAGWKLAQRSRTLNRFRGPIDATSSGSS